MTALVTSGHAVAECITYGSARNPTWRPSGHAIAESAGAGWPATVMAVSGDSRNASSAFGNLGLAGLVAGTAQSLSSATGTLAGVRPVAGSSATESVASGHVSILGAGTVGTMPEELIAFVSASSLNAVVSVKPVLPGPASVVTYQLASVISVEASPPSVVTSDVRSSDVRTSRVASVVSVDKLDASAELDQDPN
jgi:hypothetical protein